ncbi:MAG: hypothetical protein WCG07_02065 [Candidatus Taylorbacteria bacterium]
MSLSESLKTLSHHAYLLIGGDAIHAELLSILEKKHKISTTANQDFFDRGYEHMTIDDVRDIKMAHSMRPVGEQGKKIFIIRAHMIGHEAQNALLKMLEEPAEYAHFFIIVPSASLLLPTVKSRMRAVIQDSARLRRQGFKIQDEAQDDLVEEAKKFLKLSPAKRLDVIKKITEDIKKQKKTKQEVINFLNAIQEIVYTEQGVKKAKTALEAIEKARNYLQDRSPSVKMLLEYVALNV